MKKILKLLEKFNEIKNANCMINIFSDFSGGIRIYYNGYYEEIYDFYSKKQLKNYLKKQLK
jgi:hypothetical protein